MKWPLRHLYELLLRRRHVCKHTQRDIGQRQCKQRFCSSLCAIHFPFLSTYMLALSIRLSCLKNDENTKNFTDPLRIGAAVRGIWQRQTVRRSNGEDHAVAVNDVVEEVRATFFTIFHIAEDISSMEHQPLPCPFGSIKRRTRQNLLEALVFHNETWMVAKKAVSGPGSLRRYTGDRTQSRRLQRHEER